MRVTGDLGFSSLVLVVVCVVLPVIGFVIRRKWQVSEARKDEIKRLLVLAAEETARAEKEASYEYGTAVSAAPSNLCAVCYFPATARCAQCKSVRYWCVFKLCLRIPVFMWHWLWLFVGVVFSYSYDYNLLCRTFSNFCLGLKMGMLTLISFSGVHLFWFLKQTPHYVKFVFT